MPTGDHRVPIGQARRVREGDAATVVATSYMTIEGLHAVDHLAAQGIEVYSRGTSGKLTGIIADNRKWRFRTLSAPLEAAIRREEELSLMEQNALQRESERDRGRERTRQPRRD